MSINKEIGNRFRQIADKNGGPSAFAKVLKVSPQTLNDYLSGRRIPGNKMQERLRNLECDIAWLITGKTQSEVQKNYDENVARLIEKGLTKEDYEMLDVLHGFGIKTRFDLQFYLDFDALGKKIIENAAKAGNEQRAKLKEKKSTVGEAHVQYAPVLKVAEKMTEYKSSKGKAK